MLKSTGSSSIGSGFNLQDSQGGSQLFIIPVPGDSVPSSALC